MFTVVIVQIHFQIIEQVANHTNSKQLQQQAIVVFFHHDADRHYIVMYYIPHRDENFTTSR